MAKRRVTKAIYVGKVKIGGDAEIAVQSMTKTDTRDVAATVAQIRQVEEAGCDVIRCAVPDMEAAQALSQIRSQISIPLIADIHFHYQLALEAIKGGVDALRKLSPRMIRATCCPLPGGLSASGFLEMRPHPSQAPSASSAVLKKWWTWAAR